MHKIYSKIEDKLLHMVYLKSEFEEGRTQLVNDDNFIQCAFLRLEKGHTFLPHQHIWKDPAFDKVIAQESWVVIRGSAKVFFYDTDGELLETHTLNEGDSSFTLEGGHTYEILEDDTLVYEYKTGPYEGQKRDKEHF
jgi:cupin fold WbuC family metalloprotein